MVEWYPANLKMWELYLTFVQGYEGRVKLDRLQEFIQVKQWVNRIFAFKPATANA